MVDHVIESAGALTFQIKQAEALIGALRRERDLACDLKAAISALGDESEEVSGNGQVGTRSEPATREKARERSRAFFAANLLLLNR